MKRYEKYKDSGIEWIGEIPEHWEVKKLKYVAKINPSKNNGIDKNSTELVVFLPMEKVREDGTIDTEIKKTISELYNGFTFFQKNDVIIAKITPCFENGKGALIDDLETNFGFGSTEFHVLRSDNKTYPLYLYYITKSGIFMKMGEAFMTGAAGQKRVPSDFISHFQIAIPELNEQTAIATYLDRKTAEIDDLIAKKEKLLTLYEEEKTAIINQAVTGKLKIKNEKLKMKDSGIDWLGEIPEHWEVKKLKYELDFYDNQRIPLSSEIRGKMLNKIYDYYGASGVIDKVENFIFDGEYILLGEDGANLLTRSTSLAFKATGKFWVNNHAHILKPKYGLIEYFVDLLENIDYTIWVSGSAQPKLTAEALSNIDLIVPPIDEQITIVKYIEKESARIDTKIKKTKRLINLQKEYRTALISEVVTGKVKV